MIYSRTIFIAATSQLEDTPKDIGSALALDYLNAWTSLWDPRLLVAANAIPEWRRCDTSGLDLEDCLMVCPEASLEKIEQPLLERVRMGRNQLIPSARRPRHEIVQSLLDAYRDRSVEIARGNEAESISDHASCCFSDDFFAFGYAVLQVQAMARKLRYSFNLDWMVVGEQVLSAAKAALRHEPEETDRWLSAAFDSLSQERDRYCSQQGNLLNMLLVAPTTLGDSLLNALDADQPLTIYATTQVLRQWREKNPHAWQKLLERLQSKSACLAGGLRDEQPHAWLPEEALLRELCTARDDCIKMEIEPPRVWMRFSTSIAMNLATIAKQFGFRGAIVAPLAGGSIPKKEHAKIRWQGTGGIGGLDCILGHVLDANDGEVILNLGSAMAQQLDYHQVPTLVLAHWPLGVSPVFQDVLLATKRTPALGKWMDAESYFATTAQPYWSDTFSWLDFQQPLPKSASELHALHAKIIQKLRCAYQLEQLESVVRLWAWTPRLFPADGDGAGNLEHCLLRCQQLWDFLVDESADMSLLNAECDKLATAIVEQLRTRIPHQGEDIVFNTTSRSRRVFLADYPRRIDPGSCTRILGCDSDFTSSQFVIEVPPFGFAKVASQPPRDPVPSGGGQVPEGRVQRPGLIGRIFGSRTAVAQDDGSMANEFMEVQIDPIKGHLRSLYVVNKRGNRLSGQLCWSTQPLQLRNQYPEDSFLAITDVRLRVIHSSKVRGTLQVLGRLGSGEVDIRYTLWHGSPWLDIDLCGEGVDSQVGFPVWRMVWPSEAASISAWSQGAKGKLPSPLQCAVELIEIDDAEHRIHFATGGLSMHRRVGPNGLASAIPVERHGGFAAGFSVGIDWSNPWAASIDRMVPNLVSIAEGGEQPSAGKSSDTGAWLARCNVSNLHFRWIDPQPWLGLSSSGQHEHAECEEGIPADGCVWMVEMAGKGGTAKFGCVRPIERAWRVDFRGLEYDKLKVQDGEALVTYQAWDRFRIAVCFKR